jgi:hypothetical protein
VTRRSRNALKAPDATAASASDPTGRSKSRRAAVPTDFDAAMVLNPVLKQ